jgi:hypothetical protein
MKVGQAALQGAVELGGDDEEVGQDERHASLPGSKDDGPNAERILFPVGDDPRVSQTCSDDWQRGRERYLHGPGLQVGRCVEGMEQAGLLGMRWAPVDKEGNVEQDRDDKDATPESGEAERAPLLRIAHSELWLGGHHRATRAGEYQEADPFSRKRRRRVVAKLGDGDLGVGDAPYQPASVVPAPTSGRAARFGPLGPAGGGGRLEHSTTESVCHGCRLAVAMDSDDKTVDITKPRYQKWVQLVFDHPLPQENQKDWYWAEGLSFDVGKPAALLRNFTRLCSEFREVVSKYSLPQIDQGLWCLLSGQIQLGKHLMDPAIPLRVRTDCIHSMYRVFADFVALHPAEISQTCFWMWWDLIGHDFWSWAGVRRMDLSSLDVEEVVGYATRVLEAGEAVLQGADAKRALPEPGAGFAGIPEVGQEDLDEDELAIQDAIFKTLARILTLPDNRAQKSALHGLGHLHHPKGATVVQAWLEDHRGELDEAGREWVEQCRDGNVM